MKTSTAKERFAYLMYNRPPAGRVKTKQMETLKLEVGKTYRNRKGKEVKIVGTNDSELWPFVGDNGRRYAESGSCWYSEDLDDLIEEVSETRHTFKIPDDVKEVTIEQVGNRIVVDMVPEEAKEPKPGDVMVNEKGSVYIFRGEGDSVLHDNYCVLFNDGKLGIGCQNEIGRLATPEESKLLFDALRKAGKRWNTETMEVEEVPESDRILEWVWANLKSALYDKGSVAEAIEEYLKYREGKK